MCIQPQPAKPRYIPVPVTDQPNPITHEHHNHHEHRQTHGLQRDRRLSMRPNHLEESKRRYSKAKGAITGINIVCFEKVPLWNYSYLKFYQLDTQYSKRLFYHKLFIEGISSDTTLCSSSVPSVHTHFPLPHPGVEPDKIERHLSRRLSLNQIRSTNYGDKTLSTALTRRLSR